MGLLESLLTAVSGNVSSTGVLEHPIGPALGSLIAGGGGLAGLKESFTNCGLGGPFSSWVARGQNQPVSPAQVVQALGVERIQNLACDLGLSPTKASGFLAEYLPEIVNQLTPDGRLESDDFLQNRISDLLPTLLAGYET